MKIKIQHTKILGCSSHCEIFLMGKFIVFTALNVCIRKEEKPQIDNLGFHLKKLEKKSKNKLKTR